MNNAVIPGCIGGNRNSQLGLFTWLCPTNGHIAATLKINQVNNSHIILENLTDQIKRLGYTVPALQKKGAECWFFKLKATSFCNQIRCSTWTHTCSVRQESLTNRDSKLQRHQSASITFVTHIFMDLEKPTLCILKANGKHCRPYNFPVALSHVLRLYQKNSSRIF